MLNVQSTTSQSAYDHYLYSDSQYFSVPPDMRSASALGTQGYSSLYAVTRESAEGLRQAGTAADFKGCVWSERLWIDVDSYETAPLVEERLMSMGLDFIVFDSGGKGAHFGILRNTEPSHLLPYQDKAWVKANFEGLVDTSIYSHLHLFRLEGSVHERTGRKKEMVGGHITGKALVLPRLERKPREEVVTQMDSSQEVSIFKCLRVMSYTRPAKVGDRHRQLLTLAHALRDDAGVGQDVAIFWLREVNKMFEAPRPDEDLTKLVSWIYGPGRAA